MRGPFFQNQQPQTRKAGRVRGKSHDVLPSSACSAVRLHKPGGAMLAPRATRAQRARRLATITSYPPAVLLLRPRSCCLTSRRQQARSRFAGTQLAEVLVSCSPRGYLLVRRRVGHLPRHSTVRACPCVLVCVSGEIDFRNIKITMLDVLTLRPIKAQS